MSIKIENLRRLIGAATLSVCCGLSAQAFAAINLGTTRIVVDGKSREASISAKNASDAPYLVQAWVDAGEGKNETPFFVNPPLSRLDAGKENILRIQRTSDNLPQDRESLFWLNVKEIPQKTAEENVMQIAIRTRLKVFFRPTGLSMTPEAGMDSLKWTVIPGKDGHGATLKVTNPSPYHITFSMVEMAGDAPKEEGLSKLDMVLPFDSLSYEMKDAKTAKPIHITYSMLNDFGGATPAKTVDVPVDSGDAATPAKDKPAIAAPH